MREHLPPKTKRAALARDPLQERLPIPWDQKTATHDGSLLQILRDG